MEYGLVGGWLATYLALYAVGLPLAAALCPRLADRGAGVALPLSLAVVGLVAYWVGHLSFGPVALLAGLFVLVALFALTSSRGVVIARRPAVETAVVFSLAFLFLVSIRAVDPAVHPAGGEKFLDFGLLRSLLRASALPPQDVWFAGSSVQYYYGGHMLSALLAKLTFTEARYAYNLALAGFYATLVAAAYGLAGSVGASVGAPRVTASAFGAFFAGFASNLQTAFRVFLWALPSDVARSLALTVEGAITLSSGALLGQTGPFSYWSASRVILGTINEFPLFAWLNGDLHAHMMSTPFLLLVAALCFSYFRTPAGECTRRWLLLGAIATLAGLVAVINTWSFPTTLGLTWLTLGFAPADPRSLVPWRRSTRDAEPPAWLGREFRRFGGALVLTIALALVAVGSSAPFWLDTASGRALVFFPERSSLVGLLIVHGGFLLVFVPYLYRYARALDSDHQTVLGWLLVITFGLGGLLDFAALALIGPVALAAYVLVRLQAGDDSSDGAGVGFPALLMLAGAGLVLLVEVAYLREQAGPGRYNTVFKTYMQVWVLWSPPAGAALARLTGRGRPTPTETPFSSAKRATALTGGVGFAQAFALLLVLSTSVYGSLSLVEHARGGHYDRVDEPTLDSLAYVENYHPDEAPAIFWLANRSGQPVVVAAPGVDSYAWTNPESSLTGLPTVAGWIHEIGYRNESVYFERVEDVDAIYTAAPNRTVTLLRRYDVRYIYVGPRERERYGNVSFERIEGIRVTERLGDVVIYRVEQDELSTL